MIILLYLNVSNFVFNTDHDLFNCYGIIQQLNLECCNLGWIV